MPNIIDFINSLGNTGFYISMFLEGASIPFPGIMVVLTLVGVLKPKPLEAVWTALQMGLVYTLASYIPYLIGIKFEDCVRHRLSRKFYKIQYWFRKYGEWSILIFRPFGMGNYISYIAGMSRVNPLRYGVLTLAGIFPWALTVLFFGNIYPQSFDIVHFINSKYGSYIVIAGAVIIILWPLISFSYNLLKKEKAVVAEEKDFSEK